MFDSTSIKIEMIVRRKRSIIFGVIHDNLEGFRQIKYTMGMQYFEEKRLPGGSDDVLLVIRVCLAKRT